ncbi:hypothetical protein HD593_005990 [Nonomuraea rubra]|uniref:Transposase n=1 Tax=Nonomuraea rubra TaxID=46180 RepID=A0A7X0NX26_9ACTN|nr:hypothetical protein [Nonomuraea rubra]
MGDLLRAAGFSLQGMAKRRAGSQVPDRDAQFQHINTTVEQFLADGSPVVSVDAKKKEPIGDFARAGRTCRPKKRPITAPDHDFTFADTPVAIPYGVYDLGQDVGWVNVAARQARRSRQPLTDPEWDTPGHASQLEASTEITVERHAATR